MRVQAWLILASVGAVGVPTAQGAIVYHDPPDITARVTSVPPMFTTVVESAPVDLDLDGIDDIQVSVSRSRFLFVNDFSAWTEPLRPGPAAAGNGFEAERFAPPAQIGTGQAFQTDPAYVALYDSGATTWYGAWAGGEIGLAGVRFDRGARNHYGWVRIRFDVSTPDLLPSITVLDWAWESLPDTPIPAGAVPAPSVVATLPALSLLALSSRRRTVEQGGTP